MWKQLVTTGLLIGAIAASPIDALADHRDRGDDWERREHSRHWDRPGDRHDWDRRQHRHWRDHDRYYWRGHWYRTPPPYRHNRRHRHHRHDHWAPTYFGGALLGSAITYSLLHDRNDHRFCDHRRRHR